MIQPSEGSVSDKAAPELERPEERKAPGDQPKRLEKQHQENNSAAQTAARERETTEGAVDSLLSEKEMHELQARSSSLQTEFVDEPQATLEKADALVADVMSRLGDVFAQQHSALEKHWRQGDRATTEDLRQALQKYRAFFQRLLTI
jgi:hypothetical protein